MLRWFKKQRVYTQLMLIFLITILMLLIFTISAYNSAVSSARGKTVEYCESLIDQVENTIETNYNAYSKIIRLISFDEGVQHFLLSGSESERVEQYTSLKRTLSDISTLNGQIVDIIVADLDGQSFNLADAMIDLPEMDLSDNLLHTSDLAHRRVINTEADYIVMGKSIHSIDSYNQTNQLIGTVHLVNSSAAFTGSESGGGKTPSDIQLFVVDGQKKLVWSNSAKATQESFDAVYAARDKQSYWLSSSLNKIGYTIIAVQTAENVFESVIDWQTSYLLALMLIVCLVVLLWILWARNLVHPLRSLKQFIEKMQLGSLDSLSQRVSIGGYHEAEVIGSEFNALLERTRILTEELVSTNSDLYESQLLAKQSELAHLRSQINPHFLYNTLETMVGIAYTNHQPEIAEIARSLSIIFKFSIKGEDIVPLKTEFKIARNYISIQHYRFSERFDVVYDMPEECMGLMVPKLILQPLIENAIVHGIEQKNAFCHLSVLASRRDGVLALTVRDDGMGILPDTLKELTQKLQAPVRSIDKLMDTAHIGILNVDSRIKLLYGREYGIRITSEYGVSTTVTILLPIRQEVKP